MQELIEYLQNNATKVSMMNTYQIIELIEPYLEKEREQIIEAHINGQSDHHYSFESRMSEAEEYYNQINKLLFKKSQEEIDRWHLMEDIAEGKFIK